MKYTITRIIYAVACCHCLLGGVALANEDYTEVAMSEVNAGSLLLADETSGKYLQIPALDTTMNVVVTGLLANHKVTQTFYNSTDKLLHATYVFPLPDDAAVDSLSMVIGSREVEGEIHTKDRARKIYRQAQQQGQRASLVERHRPNLFTTQLANVRPNEAIEITIGYQSSIRYDEGVFHLALPTTITPRYRPGMQFQSVSSRMKETETRVWGATPVEEQTSSPKTPDTGIRVVLHSGFPLSAVQSDSHQINTDRNGLVWTIEPDAGRIASDRDFSLSWKPFPGESPLAAAFTQHANGVDTDESFMSLMIVPPQTLFDDALPAREVIFVLDKSGSMGGTSMPAAKRALQQGIERLSEKDTFNVITFDNKSRMMFGRAINATRKNKHTATARVGRIQASGGTEILGAFKNAFDSVQASDLLSQKRVRQIVFITDGSVGNEAEIFAYLKQHLGDNRIFTIGIGKAPNRWFMRKAAELGRGSYTYIATSSEVQRKMDALFHKIERSVLGDVKLTFTGMNAPEFYPEVVPDLYAGEPIIVNARTNDDLRHAELVVAGEQDGVEWSQRFSLTYENQINHTGLDKLWAFGKISALEDQLLFSTDQQVIEAKATKTALKYSLVSDYTSLVAVDKGDSPKNSSHMYAQLDGEQEPATPAKSQSANTLATNTVSGGSPAPRAVVSAPAGDPMAVPQGNLGIVARLLLSLFLTAGVAAYAGLTGRKNETA